MKKNRSETAIRSGRSAMKRRCAVWIMATLLTSGILSGCSSGGISTERKQIADDFAEMILVCDSSSAAWDTLLEAIGTYADSGEDTDLMSAIETCYMVYDQLAETLDTYTWESPSEEYLELLEKEGISAEDYKYMAMWAEYDAQSYTQSLLLIEEELVNAYYGEMDWDSFVTAYEHRVELQIYTRQAGWYMYVNYWFAEWTGDDLAYVQEVIVDQLTSYQVDGLPWDDDRSSIEDRLTAIYDSIEELSAELQEEVQELDAEDTENSE